MSYPKIKSLEVLLNFRLRVIFASGEVKIYDCKPLFSLEAFLPLKNEIFFKAVKVDSGGYGISWNDDIDLAESELWINGINESSQVAENIVPYDKNK